MASSNLIFGLPPATFLALALALTAALPAGLVYLIVQQTGPRARLRARLNAIAGHDDSTVTAADSPQRRLRQLERRLKETGHTGKVAARRSVALRLRLERAGLTISLRTFYVICAVSGLTGTLIYLVLGYPPLFAVAVLAEMGAGIPLFILGQKAKRRQRSFTKLFADAIDVIVRGIRSGLPVSECLAIIARESPDPLGAEFKLIVEGQRLGMTIKQALERACARMPTADMKFFAVVLNLQQQTGGNLAETLAGLSGTLRGRKKMAEKVRAMSSEARMTASIIGSMPFLLSLAIYALNPAYISLLWTDPLGKMILYGGLAWMGLGLFIMKKMISFEA